MAVPPHSVSLTPSVSGHVQQGRDERLLFSSSFTPFWGPGRQTGPTSKWNMEPRDASLKSHSGALQVGLFHAECDIVQAHAAVCGGGAVDGVHIELFGFDTLNTDV